MKRILLLIFAILCALPALAQHPDHAPVPDHAPTHAHAEETPGALIESAAKMVSSQPGERRLYSFTAFTPRFGLSTQRAAFADVGVGLDFYKIGYTAASEYVSFGYSNLRPYVSGEIGLTRDLLVGARTGVEYIRSTPILGMAFGGDVSWMSGPDGRRAVLVTPRLVFSFVRAEVYYGYNIFIHNELTRWIGHHRFGVSMTLNPRFWRRKREIYSDYYNTYKM